MGKKLELIETLPKLPARSRAGHKGDYGRVLVVGGSRGMIGAPSLAGLAGLRGGAGLVTIASPEPVQLAVAMLCPCATSIPLVVDSKGGLAPEAIGELHKAAGGCDILAVGPGLGTGVPQENVVRAALQQKNPVVLDADGLNNLAAIEDWASLRRCPLVLTPHPGEFARLTHTSTPKVQGGRQDAVMAAMDGWGPPGRDVAPAHPLILVLKGAGTIVTDGRRVYVNATGNPGMATGGSGDVLTGLIAGMAMQGLGLFEAVCLAVSVHGRAGDLAAEKLTEESLIASDLLDFIPDAMKEITENDSR